MAFSLHNGQNFMLEKNADPDQGKDIRRYKSFLFVGLAYLLVAVIGSAILLLLSGAEWSFTSKGVTWSFLAGVVGAIGAFGVLLAFGAGGKPAVVMSIVFAGAPIVNAVVATLAHPPENGWSAVRPGICNRYSACSYRGMSCYVFQTIFLDRYQIIHQLTYALNFYPFQ